MTRLDQLISELCPDGVEHITLGDIATDMYRGTGIKRDQVTESGTPCVRYGEIYTTYGVWFDTCVSHTDEAILTGKKYFEHGDILFAITGERVEEIAKSCVYIGNEKCLAGGDVVVMKHDQDPKYMAYALATTDSQMQKSKGKVKSKVVHSSIPALQAITIPLPLLPIQQEIARILDTFTALEAELEAELEKRKTQYEYYRDELMIGSESWESKKIIDLLCQPISDGPHITPTFVSSGIPFISVDSIWNGQIHFENKRGYITEEFDVECCKKYKPQKHDVYMVKSGSTTGKVAYVDTDERFNIWSPLAAMRVNKETSPRFLFHLLQTKKVQEQVKTRASHGSQPNLGMRALEQFDVKIPPLPEQERIAAILDRFDALVNDITQGLPAEIAARRKQYEYYRDKLLTFPRKEVAQ
ncbi:MAG: restriction endonuclease subunit S [Oscillospiraceae bacterium]